MGNMWNGQRKRKRIITICVKNNRLWKWFCSLDILIVILIFLFPAFCLIDAQLSTTHHDARTPEVANQEG